MFQRVTCLVAIILTAGLVSWVPAADVHLMGRWTLDGHAQDTSGNDRNGTLNGTPSFGPGVYGEAMEFDGDDFVSITDFKGVLGTNPWSVTAWIKTSNVDDHRCVISWGTASNGQRIELRTMSGTGILRANHGAGNVNTNTALTDGEWHHIALTSIEGAYCQYPDMTIYVDGQDDTVPSTDTDPMLDIVADVDLGIGYRATHDDRYWVGSIDEVRMYDKVLTQQEIQQIMNEGGEPYPYAYDPSPADGALHEDAWVNLSWSPGGSAVSHDVYLGDRFNDVNDGARDSEVFRGNQTATFYVAGFPGFAYPDGLVPGTTYYWRIDEVNEADPNSPWKGSVWSFTVPSKKAHNPKPANGVEFVGTEVELSWTAGLGAVMHTVYFGTSFDDVNEAASGAVATDPMYSPGSLEFDTTYFWRVDEFDGLVTRRGDVWSFTTKPSIAVSDPNLVCWWKLDEGAGENVLDWSGHGHDATFDGQVEWAGGYDGSALRFVSEGDSVVCSLDDTTDWPAGTVTLWAKADRVGQDQYSSVFSSYYPNTAGFQLDVDGGNPGLYRVNFSGGQISPFGTAKTAWVHLAMSFEGTSAQLYYDGDLTANGTLADTTFNEFAIGINRNAVNSFAGLIDEVRVYDKALTEEEIEMAMRIDPQRAWTPSPADGSTPDIDAAVPLSWTRGDDASQHDVYFGTNREAIENADSSDATGIYRGRQNATTYTPADVEWGGGPYSWRIDEVNTDGTLTKGKIWSFTVADFILVDDFESYTDNDTDGQAIWQHWIDGFGIADNGAQVGYLMPPYAEQVIIHSGDQSMPLMYDNTAGVTNSEAVLTLTPPRDWTRHSLTALSLWFRGYPGSVGSFVEAPAGTYTMTGSGADIWGAADQFHFAFKTLSGPGSIVARVNSVQNTNAWAKAGVMIRETLDAGSKHAFACVTPGNGVASQGRTATDGTSFSTDQAGVAAPYWVKLERDASGNFTVSHSANGTTWESVGDSIPTNIPMTSSVYIGLALTSHDAAQTCQAIFSNLTMTGNVSGQWAHRDVGISTNAAEPMYVELSNANGAAAIVAHDDPAAATIDTWTEWRISLQAFADQGVDLANVDSIAIGLGTKAGLASSGGSGTIYFDDIRLYRSDHP
jgi:hypothetical protein